MTSTEANTLYGTRTQRPRGLWRSHAKGGRASQFRWLIRLYRRDWLSCALMNDQDIIALYDAHARDLLGWFARRTADPQLALDLLSVTFLKAFEQRGRARAQSDGQRAAWLYRIAANALIDHTRSGASEQRALARVGGELRPLDDHETSTIEQLAASAELQRRVGAAMDGLSAEQRAALDLRVIEERPYPEISQLLGVSEPVVRARVSRGLRALRRAAGARKEQS